MPSPNVSLLPDEDWNKLQAIADRFADERRQGPVRNWPSYLPDESDRLFKPTLAELVKIDLEMAWQSGVEIHIETYVDKYPELAPVPVDLIVEEYRVRHAHGDKPDPAEFFKRFPESFAEFEKRVQSLPAQSTRGTVTGAAPVAATVRKDVPAAPTPSPATSSQLARKVCPEGYKMIELLGRGNFGEVWRAEAPGGVELALKIVTQPMTDDGAKREFGSLELIKKLQHPALLALFAYWIIDNRLVIAMELADGSLRDRLRHYRQKSQPGIPGKELISYFQDVAVGLDDMHWQGVLHRDIKPENILLKKGYAKIADFGLAKQHAAVTDPSALASGSFAGTPAFMAPEIWGGKISKQSDQYSLAFTYAELRLGRRPLAGDTFVEVMNSTMEGNFDLGHIPVEEADVLRRALHKDPAKRFESCREFVRALERAMGVQSIERPSAQGTMARPDVSGGRPSDGTLGTDQNAPRPKSGSGDRTQIEQPKAPSWKEAPKPWAPQKPPKPIKPSGSKTGLLVGLAVLVVVGIGVGVLIWKWPIGGPSIGTASTEVTKPDPGIGKPPDDKPVLPPGRFEPATGAQVVGVNGKRVYDKVMVSMPEGPAATFLLLQPVAAGEPKAYYVLEFKAWNAVVQDFIKKNSGQIDEAKWKGGPPMLPAVNLTWDEATKIAKSLGGRLPTTAEWDSAAGFFQKGEFGNSAAIKRETPLPVDQDQQDVSPKKIHNMAGNGREFTSETLLAAGDTLVVLRGRMFTLSRPLTYADIEAERKPERTQTQFPARTPQTGFRIVVDVP